MELNIDDNHYEKDVKTENIIEWIPFLRQLFIVSGLWMNCFMYGLSMGVPTVLIPQLRREANSTAAVSIHMESWLSSGLHFSGIPCVVILTAFAYLLGRKRTGVLISASSVIGFTVLYCSTDVKHILIYEIILGPLTASQITTSFMISSEYFSPRYRGWFLAIEKATIFWGVWVSNAIGTFAHWKNIGLLGIFCSIYGIINILFWRESPYWLSVRGRLNESVVSHKWLKGSSEESKRELANLVKLKEEFSRNLSIQKHIKNFWNVIFLPEVYKALALCALFICMFNFSGKLVCTMYSIKIIKNITESEFTAYTGMLILDGVTVFSMYCGSILMRYIKRKTYVISTASITIIFLYVLSIYLYLIKFNVIRENKYVSIVLLAAFNLSVSVGPITISGTILAELLPLKSRSISVCILALLAMVIMSIMFKITPYLFITLEISGTFLFFGVLSSVCLFLAYKYSPETKNKTLLEISDILKGSYKSDRDDKKLELLKSCNMGEEKNVS